MSDGTGSNQFDKETIKQIQNNLVSQVEAAIE